MPESKVFGNLTRDQVMELYEVHYFFLELADGKSVGIEIEEVDDGIIISGSVAPEEYQIISNYVGVVFDEFDEIPSPEKEGETRLQMKSKDKLLLLHISYNE